MAEKNGLDMTNLIFHACHCGAVVRQLLARADELGSTPGDADVFLSVQSLFFNAIFPFDLFSFILTADPAHAAWINIYFQLSLEFYFGKKISRALDLHTGQAYGQKKT